MHFFSHERTDLTGIPEGPFHCSSQQKKVYLGGQEREEETQHRKRETDRHTDTWADTQTHRDRETVRSEI